MMLHREPYVTMRAFNMMLHREPYVTPRALCYIEGL